MRELRVERRKDGGDRGLRERSREIRGKRSLAAGRHQGGLPGGGDRGGLRSYRNGAAEACAREETASERSRESSG